MSRSWLLVCRSWVGSFFWVCCRVGGVCVGWCFEGVGGFSWDGWAFWDGLVGFFGGGWGLGWDWGLGMGLGMGLGLVVMVGVGWWLWIGMR